MAELKRKQLIQNLHTASVKTTEELMGQFASGDSIYAGEILVQNAQSEGALYIAGEGDAEHSGITKFLSEKTLMGVAHEGGSGETLTAVTAHTFGIVQDELEKLKSGSAAEIAELRKDIQEVLGETEEEEPGRYNLSADLKSHTVSGDVQDLQSAAGFGLDDNGNIVYTTHTVDDETAYINTATTLDDADVNLDKAIQGVQAQIDAMDTGITATTTDGHVTITLGEADGIVSAITVSDDIHGGSIYLTGYTSGTSSEDIVSADTVNTAFGKIENRLEQLGTDALEEVLSGNGISVTAKVNHKQTVSVNIDDTDDNGVVLAFTEDGKLDVIVEAAEASSAIILESDKLATANAVREAINDLNVEEVSATSKFIRSIKEENGLITATTDFIADSDVKLSAATESELETLGTNVREAYKLVNGNNAQLGNWIKIYKDSSLVDSYLGHVDDKLTEADNKGESPTSAVTSGTGDTALCFINQLENTKYKLTAVDVSKFLEESEFKDGLEVTNHVVKVKIDANSEKYTFTDKTSLDLLTVSEDGVKLDGIDDLVLDEISKLNSSIDSGLTASVTADHVGLKIVEENGIITTAEIYENISGTNVQLGADVEMEYDGEIFTAHTITGTSSITQAIQEVCDVIVEDELVIASALTNLNARLTAATTGYTSQLDGYGSYTLEQNDAKITAFTMTLDVASAGTDIATAKTESKRLASDLAVKQYVDEKAGAATTEVEAGANDDTKKHLSVTASTDSTTSAKTYTINLKDIQGDKIEMGEAFDEEKLNEVSLNIASGVSIFDAVSGVANYTRAMVDALDATANTSANYAAIEIVEENGKLSSVALTATTGTVGTYGEEGATNGFATAEDVRAYFDALDATVSGSNKYFNYEFTQVDGKLSGTGITLNVAITSAATTAATSENDSLVSAYAVKQYVESLDVTEFENIPITYDGTNAIHADDKATLTEVDGKINAFSIQMHVIDGGTF